jgi:hypothetical protein
MTLEIQMLACLSTGHVDERTARELDALVENPVLVAARDVPKIWQGQIIAERWQQYGSFVWVRVSIIRTGNPLQPFHVSTAPSRDADIEVEIVS